MKNLHLAAALLAASCATGVTTAQEMPDPFSQAGPAIQARQGVHQLMGANVGDALALLTGKKEFDGYKLMNRVDALSQLSEMSRDFFTVPGSYEDSNAKPSILTNFNDYKDMERALYTATFGLRTAVRNRDPHAGKTALMSVVKACNSCHAVYMKEPLILGPKPPAGAH
jgi:cytochrome c556